jgi:hypothetical protein
MKPTKEIVKTLKNARDLFTTHELCKGAYARNAKGKKVDTLSPDVASFCIAGAIARAEGLPVPEEQDGFYYDAIPQTIKYINSFHGESGDGITVSELNDRRSTTKEQVVTFFDILIAKAKSELKA